jgi:hypothetical protein
MPRPNEIIIDRCDLEGPEPFPDLARVKALIDGAPAEVMAITAESITVRAPREGDGPWTIEVTADDGKFVLGVLDSDYDAQNETFTAKQQEGLEFKETTLDEVIDRAADKIVAAIGGAARPRVAARSRRP